MNYVDIREFGADTFAEDNSQFILAALNAASDELAGIFIPPGEWKISSPINLSPFDTRVVGAGYRSSVLRLNSLTQDGIIIGDRPCYLADFAIHSSAEQTFGDGIRIGNGVSHAPASIIERVRLQRMYVGIHSKSANSARVNDCEIAYSKRHSVWWDDVFNPAAGEYIFHGNVFVTDQLDPCVHFFSTTGSGFRFTNNKFLGGERCMVFSIGGDAMCDWQIVCNSFEGFRLSGILFNQGIRDTANNVQIVANEFNMPFGGFGVCVQALFNQIWLSRVVVNSNVFGLGGVGLNVPVIDLNGVRVASVSNNMLEANGVTLSHGIMIRNRCGTGKSNGNVTSGISHPFATQTGVWVNS